LNSIVIRLTAYAVIVTFAYCISVNEFVGHYVQQIVAVVQATWNERLDCTWRNDWRRRDNASTILGQIRRTSGSRLILKSEFEFRITFVSNFDVGGGLHSLLQTEHL